MSNDPVDGPIEGWRRELPESQLAGLELSGRLRAAEHEFSKWRTRVLAPFDIDAKEWDVLSALWRTRTAPMSMSDVGDELLLVAGSVTHRISALERRGFAQRTMDSQNRRRTRVTLTETGVEKVLAALPAAIRASDRLESTFTVDSIAHVNILLRELYAVITQEV